MTTLFQQPLSVINLGLESFADNLREAGGEVLHLQWQPVAQGDEQAGWTLATLLADERIKAANEQALQRYLDAQPVLVDVAKASEAISGLNDVRKFFMPGHRSPGAICAARCRARLLARLF